MAHTISTSLGHGKPGSEQTNSLEIIRNTPPPIPLARSFLNMVYPGGHISESEIESVNQDSVPIITSAWVASKRLSNSGFFLAMERQLTTATSEVCHFVRFLCSLCLLLMFW